MHLCVVSESTHVAFPLVSLYLALASVSIFRCYCEAALMWAECERVCVFSQKSLSDAVNQLPSGCSLTEQRSASAGGIAPLITQMTHTHTTKD